MEAAAPQQADAGADGKQDGERAALENARNQQTVFAQRRVETEAGQKDAIDDGADASLTGLEQRELDVARPELDAVQVARDARARRQRKDGRRVRVLLAVRVEGVAKAELIGQPLTSAFATPSTRTASST